MLEIEDPHSDAAEPDLSLFAPLGRERFVADHWGQSPADLPGWEERFAGLYSLESFRAHLAGDMSPGRDRVAPALLKAVHNQRGGGAIFHPPPNMAMELFDSGMTLCASGLEAHDCRLSDLLTRLGRALAFAGRMEANAYYSPANEGFAWHYDCQHVFILQIAGSKRWEISARPGVEAPPLATPLDLLRDPAVQDAARRVGLDIRPPDQLDILERLLSPGDALYLPPGVWHRAFAGSYSFALTLTLHPLSLAQVAQAIVAFMTVTQADGRRDLHCGAHNPLDDLSSAYQDRCDAVLSDLWDRLAALKTRDILNVYAALQREPFLRAVILRPGGAV